MFDNEWPNIKREYYMRDEHPHDLDEHELFCYWCGHSLLSMGLSVPNMVDAVLFASQYIATAPTFDGEKDVQEAYAGLNEKGLIKNNKQVDRVTDPEQYIEI